MQTVEVAYAFACALLTFMSHVSSPPKSLPTHEGKSFLKDKNSKHLNFSVLQVVQSGHYSLANV